MGYLNTNKLNYNVVKGLRTNKTQLAWIAALLSITFLAINLPKVFADPQPPSTQTTITKVQDGTPVDAAGDYDAPNDNSASPSPGIDPGPTNGYVKNLDTVIYEVEVTQNDADGTNITSTIVLDDNSRWDSLPSVCLTDASLVPMSELQDNDNNGLNETMVCNLGDHDEGTKLIFDVIAVATGEHEDTFFPTACADADENMNQGGSYAAGECDDADPVEITAGFGMIVSKDETTSSGHGNKATRDLPGGISENDMGHQHNWYVHLSYVPGSEFTNATDFTFTDSFVWYDTNSSPIGGLDTQPYFHTGDGNECEIVTQHTVHSTVTCTQPDGIGTPIIVSVTGVNPRVTGDSYEHPYLTLPSSSTNLMTIRLSTWTSNAAAINDSGETLSFTLGMDNTVELTDASGDSDVVSTSGQINPTANEVSLKDSASLFTVPGGWDADKTFTSYNSSKHFGSVSSVVGDLVPTQMRITDTRTDDYVSAVCDVIDTSSFEFAGDTLAMPGGTHYHDWANGVTQYDGTNEYLHENHNPTLFTYDWYSTPRNYDFQDATTYGTIIEYSDTPASPDHWEGDCTDANNTWYSDYNSAPGGLASITKVRMRWDRDYSQIQSIIRNGTAPTVSNVRYTFNLKVVSSGSVGDKLPNSAIMINDIGDTDNIDDIADWTNDLGAAQKDPSDPAYSWSDDSDFIILVANQQGVEKTAQTNTFDAGDDITWNITPTTKNGGDNNPYTLTLVDTIPAGLTYSSDNCAAVITDCTVSVSGQTVTLTIANHTYGDPLATIELVTSSSSFTAPGDYTNEVSLTSDSTATFIPTVNGDMSTASDTVTRIGAGGIFVQKSAQENVEIYEPFSYELTYANTGPSDRNEGIIIDVFPFIGDDQAHTFRDPSTDYHGSLAFASTVESNGETYEYTTDDPTTVHIRPCHPDNWPAGDVLGGANTLLNTVCEEGLLNPTDDPDPTQAGTGTTTWTTGPIPTDGTATAMRVVTTPMPTNSPPRAITINFQPTLNLDGDVYCNNFGSQFGQRLDEISNDICVDVVAGEIGDYLWWDNDRDGVQGTEEQPIVGAEVKLLVEDPASPGTYIPYQQPVRDADGEPTGAFEDYIATTDENGNYLFENLPSGNYRVMVDTDNDDLPLLFPTWDSDNTTPYDGTQDNMSDVTLTGPAVDPSLSDVNTDLAQDFGYVLPTDLATSKVITKINRVDGTSEEINDPVPATDPMPVLTVLPGDELEYEICIWNQGYIDVFDIQIIDYIPNGLTYSVNDTNGWLNGIPGVTTNDSIMEEFNFIPTIYPGVDPTTVTDPTAFPRVCQDLVLTVNDPYTFGTQIVNRAEVYEAFDEFDNPAVDLDSTPESEENNGGDADEGGTPGDPNEDNWIGDGGIDGEDTNDDNVMDEDDEDPAMVTMLTDAALTKKLKDNGNPNVPNNVVLPGGPITFEVCVINQGLVDLYDVQLVDYFPSGLRLDPSDPNWTWGTPSADTASTTVAGPIAAGVTECVDIIAVADDPLAAGIELTNTAEIMSFKDVTGEDVSKYDPDSTADSEKNNDGDVTDDEINNANDDEDDHDIANIETANPVVGIAKAANNFSATNNNDGTFTTTYTLLVTNEGNVPLYDLSVTDDLDATFNPSAYSVTTTPSITNTTSGTVVTATNPSFDGSTDQNLLALTAGDILTVDGSFTVEFEVTFTPDPGKLLYENQAIALGDMTEDGTTDGDTTDDSTDGSQPDQDNPGNDSLGSDYNDNNPSNDGNGDPTDNQEPTPVTIPASINITKRSIPNGTELGDTIDWLLVVTNDGPMNLVNVTVNDELAGGDVTSECDFPTTITPNGLAPGESAECLLADDYAHIITEDDLRNGYVENTATVVGAPSDNDGNPHPNTPPVTDTSDDPAPNDGSQGGEDNESGSGLGETDNNPTNDPTVVMLEKLVDTGVNTITAFISGIAIFVSAVMLGRLSLTNKPQFATALPNMPSLVTKNKKPELEAATTQQPATVSSTTPSKMRSSKIRR